MDPLLKLLREQYVAGNEDRIKLLLSGDNPNRINRDLQLMAYVSQAQRGTNMGTLHTVIKDGRIIDRTKLPVERYVTTP